MHSRRLSLSALAAIAGLPLSAVAQSFPTPCVGDSCASATLAMAFPANVALNARFVSAFSLNNYIPPFIDSSCNTLYFPILRDGEGLRMTRIEDGSAVLQAFTRVDPVVFCDAFNNRGEISASADAFVSAPAFDPALGTSTGACIFPFNVPQCPGTTAFAIGFGVSAATASTLVANNGPSPESATVSGSIFPDCPAGLMKRECIIIAVQVSESTAVCAYVCCTPNGQIVSGLILNPNTGMLEFEQTIDLPVGTTPVSATTINFNDEAFDLDGDGRLSQLDVDLLQALIGTQVSGDYFEVSGNPASPLTLRRFDFNANGIIDTSDVATLRLLVDCGLAAGILGDMDGDGQPTCDDWVLVDPFPLGRTVEDAEYRIELDADLDGLLDATDESAVRDAIALAADLTGSSDPNSLQFGVPDGIVDAEDFFYYQTIFAVGNPDADLNHDGVLDATDFFLYMKMFDTSCLG